MQVVDLATIDYAVAVAALGDLDLGGINPEVAELVADDPLCDIKIVLLSSLMSSISTPRLLQVFVIIY